MVHNSYGSPSKALVCNDYNSSGSPSMMDIEAFSSAYRARLDEAEAAGSIPKNYSLEVFSFTILLFIINFFFYAFSLGFFLVLYSILVCLVDSSLLPLLNMTKCSCARCSLD